MRVNRKNEQTAKAWAWRCLMGPAMLLDGLLSTLTIGTVSVGASLEVSRRLAMARFDALDRKK
jgi:hypothetical protein